MNDCFEVSCFSERIAANWHWVPLTAFLLFAVIETVRPDQRKRQPVLGRWSMHISMQALGLLLVSMIAPWVMFGVAVEHGNGRSFGVFAGIEAATGAGGVLLSGALALDFLIYWMHRLQHGTPVLWRFHAVHHADQDMDVSTTFRHHPVATIMVAVTLAAILLKLGMPAWVFPMYGLSEAALTTFQHLASPIPDRLERSARLLLITPGLHQVHHSLDPKHFDSNFGNLLSVWDRLFGTYMPLDAAAREQMRYGVEPYTTPECRNPLWSLTMPFRMHRPTTLVKPRAP